MAFTGMAFTVGTGLAFTGMAFTGLTFTGMAFTVGTGMAFVFNRAFKLLDDIIIL